MKNLREIIIIRIGGGGVPEVKYRIYPPTPLYRL